jgi:hypothetical protein
MHQKSTCQNGQKIKKLGRGLAYEGSQRTKYDLVHVLIGTDIKHVDISL